MRSIPLGTVELNEATVTYSYKGSLLGDDAAGGGNGGGIFGLGAEGLGGILEEDLPRRLIREPTNN